MSRKKQEEIPVKDDETDRCDKADKDDIEDGTETELHGQELITNLLENLFKVLESSNVKSKIDVSKHQKKIPTQKYSQSAEVKRLIQQTRKKISKDVFEDVKQKLKLEPGKFENFEMGIITPKFKSLETQILDRFQEFVEDVNVNQDDQTFLFHLNATSTTSEVNKHILRCVCI